MGEKALRHCGTGFFSAEGLLFILSFTLSKAACMKRNSYIKGEWEGTGCAVMETGEAHHLWTCEAGLKAEPVELMRNQRAREWQEPPVTHALWSSERS